MTQVQAALEANVARLRGIVEALDPAQLTAPAYPSEWTIADALSHLGSGSVIMKQSIDAFTTGVATPDDFNQSVWDEWNAKAPDAQAADVLVADRALMDAIGALTEEQRASFTLQLGPMALDLDGVLGLRLNEHALHTWDVEVAVDPSATIPGDLAAVVVQNMHIVLRFGAKVDGEHRSVTIHTTDPELDLVLATTAEEAALEPGSPTSTPDVELPTESLIRLVYGRLDPGHTPAGVESPVIEDLRKLFPGI